MKRCICGHQYASHVRYRVRAMSQMLLIPEERRCSVCRHTKEADCTGYRTSHAAVRLSGQPVDTGKHIA